VHRLDSSLCSPAVNISQSRPVTGTDEGPRQHTGNAMTHTAIFGDTGNSLTGRCSCNQFTCSSRTGAALCQLHLVAAQQPAAPPPHPTHTATTEGSQLSTHTLEANPTPPHTTHHDTLQSQPYWYTRLVVHKSCISTRFTQSLDNTPKNSPQQAPNTLAGNSIRLLTCTCDAAVAAPTTHARRGTHENRRMSHAPEVPRLGATLQKHTPSKHTAHLRAFCVVLRLLKTT
jgi:hypothetical protein